MEKCEVSSPSKPLRPLLRALAVALVLCQISGTFSAAAAGGGGSLRDLDAQELLNGEKIIHTLSERRVRAFWQIE